MKILVTGAAGYLGRHVLAQLRLRGLPVHALSSRPHVHEEGVSWLQADLLASGQAERLIEQVCPDVLIHLAWYAKHGSFWTARENFAWSDASARLLESFHAVGGRRAVLAGTCAEYDWSSGYCIEDVTPMAPSTLYGKCKDATRQYIEGYAATRGISYAWARIFFPYGPGEPSARLLPSVLSAMRDGRAVKCSHGRQFRDFLHVQDVASALVHLALSTHAYGNFNISSGRPVQLSSLIEMCASHFRDQVPIEFGAIAAPVGEPQMLVGSPDKLQATGWRPTLSLEDGIADYANSYIQEGK